MLISPTTPFRKERDDAGIVRLSKTEDRRESILTVGVEQTGNAIRVNGKDAGIFSKGRKAFKK